MGLRNQTMLAGLRQGRALFAWMLLAMLCLRALIPPGYMPDLSGLADGGLPLVICSGSMDTTLLVDEQGRPVKTADLPSTDAPCLFAALAALPVPLLLALALLGPMWPHATTRFVRPVGALNVPAYLRPRGDIPPRAPPILV